MTTKYERLQGALLERAAAVLWRLQWIPAGTHRPYCQICHARRPDRRGSGAAEPFNEMEAHDESCEARVLFQWLREWTDIRLEGLAEDVEHDDDTTEKAAFVAGPRA